MNWWRAHHGIANDSKLAVVALRSGTKKGEVLAVWVALLDYASQNEQDRGSTAGLDSEQLAIMTDFPVETVQSILNGMKNRGLIQQDAFLSAWSKRQPKRERDDDDAAERKRRQRAKSHHVTPENEDVTPRHTQSRGEERRLEEKDQNHNAADAACAGDTVRSLLGKPTRPGKRTMEQIIKALGDRLPWWEKFWELYPCGDGKLPGMDAFERVVTTREIAQQVMNGANAYRKKCEADPTIRMKYPQGWLNDQRWTDEITEVVRRGPKTQSTEELAAAIEAFGRTR